MDWSSWETLFKPKDMGGIGFRDIKAFDMALFMRQAWRILYLVVVVG